MLLLLQIKIQQSLLFLPQYKAHKNICGNKLFKIMEVINHKLLKPSFAEDT